MEKDLFERLQVFGLTVNQAKTYLKIVQYGSITVSQIAKFTKLHRPDIYTMLPKLEKKGLITRTLGSPVIVQAIPVEKALHTLASTEKKNALDRISRMDGSIEGLTEAINALHKVEIPQDADTYFSLLTGDNEIINRGDQLYEKVNSDCRVVLTPEILMKKASRIYQRFTTAASKGVKIRLLIEALDKHNNLQCLIQRVRPDSDNFSAKFLCSKSPKPFQIIDDSEIWISTTKRGESPETRCVLWSNGKNLIEVYRERFDRLWNNPEAVTIIQKVSAVKV